MRAAVAAVIALAGCESPARVKPWRHAPDPADEIAASAGSAATGDPGEPDLRALRSHTLRIHVDADPGRLNPLLAPTVWARRIALGTIFEPLLRYAPPDGGTAAGSYAPRLAQSWRVAPSGLEIRIELEPGVMFHDGQPLTASDVQFTLDAVRDPRHGIDHLRPMLADVEAVELISARELRLRLKRPSGWVLRALAEIPILPMHVYAGSLAAGGALIGTGPWKLVTNKGGVVRLTRFDRYWGRAPAIADLDFVYEPDAAQAIKAAKRGELDIVPSLIPAHWPEQANSPGIVAAFAPLALATPRLRYVAFNAQRAPLDDPKVRHALALLIERRTIARRVFGGLARPALWPIWPGGPVSGAEPAVADFDPAAAAKLLDAAGWVHGEPKDGLRYRNGKQLRLTMIGSEKPASKDPGAGGPQAKTERDYFVAAARGIGVVIDVRTGSDGWLDKRITDRAYDLAELSWSGMVDDDPVFLAQPSRGGEPPSQGGGAIESPGSAGARSAAEQRGGEIDRALDGLAAAWDPAERARLAPGLAAALADDWPLAGIVADAPHGLVAKRVRGVRVWDGWIDLAQLSFAEP